MDCSTPGRHDKVFEDTDKDISVIIRNITTEFNVVMGSPERVKASCSMLMGSIDKPPTPRDIECLKILIPLFPKRMGNIVDPLFDLFYDVTLNIKDPWPFLQGMLSVREERLILKALNLAASLAETGALAVDSMVLGFLADILENDTSPFLNPEYLAVVRKIVNLFPIDASTCARDSILGLFLYQKDMRLRRLAARILDLSGEPVPEDVALYFLREDAFDFLMPYLLYTRASYMDLLHIAPSPEGLMPALSSLRLAESSCGRHMLKEVVSRVGWHGINYGIECNKVTGLKIGDSFPLMISDTEAILFDQVNDASRENDICLFTCHGGLPGGGIQKPVNNDPVILFRSYNLSHARVISDFTEIGPLTQEKINRILSEMDGIVSDYMTLFSSHSKECAMLPDVYNTIKTRILSGLENKGKNKSISPEIYRLVLMFEDPPDLGAVQTLHGLKRYLHQKGLRLGFRLIDSSCPMNRTISLITSSEKRVFNVVSCISYVSFEPENDDIDPANIPYPVKIVADAFSRQMLRGEKDFPGIKIFCYGNEINYYISFRNHPVFLRISFSHPLNGGMIDLEYYGISKTEIDHHPDLSLNAIKYFFQYLGYEVEVKQTHIRVRYDKNQTMDINEIYEKAEMIFNLVPYFMDIDWIISSLNLDKESQGLVIEAWARFFKKWGVLPLDQILTKDRQGILVARKPGPTGDQETIWNGKPPYIDQTGSPLPGNLITRLKTPLKELGLDMHRSSGQTPDNDIGQIHIEKQVLKPLREALSIGGIVKGAEGLSRVTSDLFQYEWEAECFAEIISGPANNLASSLSVAALVKSLEQFTYFTDSGSLNGYRIEYAYIPVLGRIIGIYILRDGEGIIRLAFFSDGTLLCKKRKDTGATWSSNYSIDPVKLKRYLSEGNCLMPGSGAIEDPIEKVESVCEKFRQINIKKEHVLLRGERIINGVNVSPGRAVGRVVFGTGKRAPEDFRGKILVTPEVHPDDNALIYNSAGIVTTGGGILSHAALNFLQFKKPSMIIHGEWEKTPDNKVKLLSYFSGYREESKEYSGYKLLARSMTTGNNLYLEEGDLVVLDSEEGILSILGQDTNTVKFHESFIHLCETTENLMASKDTQFILTLRGRRLRALHRLEKQLAEISDPFLAYHAVHELLLSEHLSFNSGNRKEKENLLSMVLNNPGTGEAARERLIDTFMNLNNRHRLLLEKIKIQFPSYVNIYERLYMRLKLLQMQRAVKEAYESLLGCGFTDIPMDRSIDENVDEQYRTHFKKKLESLSRDMENSLSSGKKYHVRHFILQMERVDSLLGTFTAMDSPVKELREKMLLNDENSLKNLKNRFILGSCDCGIELSSLTGWKAANLSEIERLEGEGLVPPWFVVTNRALNRVMDVSIDRASANILGLSSAMPLGDALKVILARHDTDHIQKARKIMRIWEDLVLPDEITGEIIQAYNGLRITSNMTAPEKDKDDYVAIRSSAGDEDSELSTNAGLFDTFLFIQGEDAVIRHLKKVWAGFWGERALYHRSLTGSVSEMPVGGVIIQRLISSRVSGVLQTINVAEGNPREMVINAGLGLGQGIVSGRITGDRIFVEKDRKTMENPDKEINFRYLTREKTTQAVFNKREGRGIVYSSTPYHRRLLPALSYAEICGLARRAGSLEMAYGYPLDIEFCIDGDKLWILQCRPVTSFMKILQETIKHYPLSH